MYRIIMSVRISFGIYTKKKLEMWETFNAVKWDKVCMNTEWAESNEYLVYIKLSTLTMATDMHLDRIVKSLCFIYCYYHHNHWTWSILLGFFLLTVGEKIEKYFVPHMKKKYDLLKYNVTCPYIYFPLSSNEFRFRFNSISSTHFFFTKSVNCLRVFIKIMTFLMKTEEIFSIFE